MLVFLKTGQGQIVGLYFKISNLPPKKNLKSFFPLRFPPTLGFGRAGKARWAVRTSGRLRLATMKTKPKQILIWGGIGVAIVAGIYFLVSKSNKTGKLDTFAECLKDKGAVFYGAFWCPHCQNQKAMFGTSQKLLPYVECSTQDGKGQLAICKDKNIEGYPTWEFADGTRESGEVSLPQLAESTGCSLPE